MFCSLTGAIAIAFFAYLFYQSYMNSTVSDEEGIMTKITGSFDNKVSMAGANIAVVILLCYFLGWITSGIAAGVGIAAIMGLDYMEYI